MTLQIQGEGFSVQLDYDEEQGLPLWHMLVTFERAIIAHVLEKFSGNKARTADHLQLNRTTLVEKAKKYGFPYKVKKEYDEDGSV